MYHGNYQVMKNEQGLREKMRRQSRNPILILTSLLKVLLKDPDEHSDGRHAQGKNCGQGHGATNEKGNVGIDRVESGPPKKNKVR